MSDSKGETDENQVKIILVGDKSSGKTSIFERFSKDAFNRNYNQQLTTDSYLKRIHLTRSYNVKLAVDDVGEQTLAVNDVERQKLAVKGVERQKLAVNDVERQTLAVRGVERQKSAVNDGKRQKSRKEILEEYIYEVDIVLLVYDITNLQSFENLEDYYHTVVTYCAGRKVLFALVGNNSDLEHLRAVKAKRHQDFAKENDMLSYFVSAQTAESVENLFRQVTARLMHIVLPKNDNDATRIRTKPIIRQEQNHDSTLIESSSDANTTGASTCSLQ